jgi:hypothetical protein
LLRRQITYTNPFTDAEVTEEHFFHISKADLVEMELEEHDQSYVKDGEEITGMQAKLQRIVDSNDGKAILAEFKDIILRSYGKKEGDRFLKSKELSDDFAATEAFSQLLFELCTDPSAAGDFINGVVPNNIEQIAEEVRQRAEKVAAGREAQAAAKAAGGSPEVATPATNGDGPADRPTEIEAATAENPVTLTEAEVRELDSDELKSGLATGRFKIG